MSIEIKFNEPTTRVTFADLKAGDLYRYADEHYVLMKTADGGAFSFYTKRQYARDSWRDARPVVRLKGVLTVEEV